MLTNESINPKGTPMKKILFFSLITIASIAKADARQFSQEQQEEIYRHSLKKFSCFNAESCRQKQNTLAYDNFKQELANQEGLGGIVEAIQKGDLNASQLFLHYYLAFNMHFYNSLKEFNYQEKTTLIKIPSTWLKTDRSILNHSCIEMMKIAKELTSIKDIADENIKKHLTARR